MARDEDDVLKEIIKTGRERDEKDGDDGDKNEEEECCLQAIKQLIPKSMQVFVLESN